MRRFIVLALILICVSCSKFSTPEGAARNIFDTAIKDAQKGDVTGCEKAFEDHTIGRNNDGTYSSTPAGFFKEACNGSLHIDPYTHYETIFNNGKTAIVRTTGKSGSDTLNMIKSESGWVWLLQ